MVAGWLNVVPCSRLREDTAIAAFGLAILTSKRLAIGRHYAICPFIAEHQKRLALGM
jgi:hypothetical protein